jgi:hypothetical protein
LDNLFSGAPGDGIGVLLQFIMQNNDDDEENRAGNRSGPNVIPDEETVREDMVMKVLGGCTCRQSPVLLTLSLYR